MIASHFFVEMMMLKAINDRIIIKIDDSKPKSSIIINEDFPRRESGVVLETGDKVTSVKKGDRIIFHIFDEISLGGDLAVVREKSVLDKFE